ncbi:MAG TPA: transposase [Pseudonocardiaceae bacterium]|jgi:hypothetical protein|nr:transposase [Pseudonocardiaceae bacterium]
MDTFTLSTYDSWLKRIYDHISPNFYRAEPRLRAWTYLRSLADSPADGRASRRHLATYPGERRADGAQRLLTSAQWDEDRVRVDLLGFVKSTFGARGGTLYVTEMVFPKKGMHAAGVERQFSVESSRNENCQIGILLFYEAADGSLLFIDRDLYVPESWIDDPDRSRRVSMPPGLRYRSKSAIAAELVNRAIAGGLVPRWTLVSVLCSDWLAVRQALQRYGLPHLMALTPGEFSAHARTSGPQTRTAALESGVGGGPIPSQQRRSAGPLRLRAMTTPMDPTSDFEVSYLVDSAAARGGGRFSGHYYAFTERDTGGAPLVDAVASLNGLATRVARSRDEIGVDRYEVRSWRGWYRHMTLAMIAQTAMSMSRANESGRWGARPVASAC